MRKEEDKVRVTGFSLGLNFFNALTVGILGVPGLVLLVLLQMLFV